MEGMCIDCVGIYLEGVVVSSPDKPSKPALAPLGWLLLKQSQNE